jgi:hypothetical protein
MLRDRRTGLGHLPRVADYLPCCDVCAIRQFPHGRFAWIMLAAMNMMTLALTLTIQLLALIALVQLVRSEREPVNAGATD